MGYVKQTYDSACTEILKLFQFIISFRNALQLGGAALCAQQHKPHCNIKVKFPNEVQKFPERKFFRLPNNIGQLRHELAS